MCIYIHGLIHMYTYAYIYIYMCTRVIYICIYAHCLPTRTGIDMHIHTCNICIQYTHM